MYMKKLLLLLVFALCSAALPGAEKYQAPALSGKDSWSMIVLPDTQNYIKFSRNQGILDLMIGWIWTNASALNIQQVLTVGDLVGYNGAGAVREKNNVLGREQWKTFSRIMGRLDGYLPYVLCTGNHDYGFDSAENRHSHFSEFFPTDRNPRTRRQLIGCAPNAFGVVTLENAAYEFTAPAPDGRKFLIFSLEFSPRIEVLEWAKKLVDDPRFANHIGIVLTHSYLYPSGKRIESEAGRYKVAAAGGQCGEEIWTKLIYPAKNIRLVISGHVTSSRIISGIAVDKNSAGKTVTQMVFNAQNVGGGKHGNGGDGWLRILEFMPDKKTVKATTFSPLFAVSPSTQHLAWNKNANCEFTFTIE